MSVLASVIVPVAGVGAAGVAILTYLRNRQNERDSSESKRVQIAHKRMREGQQHLRELGWRLANPRDRHEVRGLLGRRDWVFDPPIKIDSVVSEFVSADSVPELGRRRRHTARILGTQERYSEVVARLPGMEKLFPGSIYRLVSVDATTPAKLRLGVAQSNYFAYLDSCELLAFELQLQDLRLRDRPSRAGKLRRDVADVFDLRNRVASLGVNTLTIRKGGSGSSFFMHKRNMTVGNEPGVYHVVPAGEFTPSSKAPEVFLRDLSVWRNIMREAAEEFLNVEEAYGEGDRGIDFTADHPYVELQEAVKSGHLVTWCFGLVIDAACLKSELLTIMVMDAREFDRTFAKMVAENREGNIIAGPSGKGVAFTKSNIDSYLSDGSVTSAAKACLALAWANQDHLKLGI